MIPSLISNNADEQSKAAAHFRQYSAWITGVAVIFGSVQLLGSILFRNIHIAGAGLTTLVFAINMLIARWCWYRGKLTAAVLISSLSILVGILIEAVILPTLTIPALIVFSIIAVISALPYFQKKHMQLLIVFSWGVGVIVMSLGEFLIPSPEFPAWFSTTFRITTTATALGLVFLLIWQFASHLSENIKQVHTINTDLAKQTARLESANRELDRFAFSISHDLRAPLRAIDEYMSFLAEDYEQVLDAEGKQICSAINNESKRMKQMIDGLLSFSRMGREEISASQIDMEKLAGSVINELVTKNDREHIDVKIDQLPPIMGTPLLIRQVWVNLLSNAIKFTSKRERAVIEVGFKQADRETIYFVRDNGAGFNMKYVDKLFGVFQRLHSERDFEGTGVGLAIVRQVIHRHDGRIWAEGEPGKGAVFYFALPGKESKHDSLEWH